MKKVDCRPPIDLGTRIAGGTVAVVLLVASSCGSHSSPRGGAGVSSGSKPRAAIDVPIRASGFLVQKTALRLPRRCAPRLVADALLQIASAFNHGQASKFANGFRPGAGFDAYSATRADHKPFLRGRTEIAAFVRARHSRGDGWTLLFVSPPTGRTRLPEAAIYGLGIRVTSHGRTVFEGGAKAVVDCASGEILNWVGPSHGPP